MQHVLYYFRQLTDEHGGVGTEHNDSKFIISSKSAISECVTSARADVLLLPFVYLLVSMIPGKSVNRFQ